MNMKHKVLDQGWVWLADHMGSDQTIVDRARGTIGSATVKSSDEDLIRLMMRKHHGSSFEFPEIDIQICCPFVVWRQMIRHRAGNILDDMTMWDEPSVNELSGRYSVVPDIIQETGISEWRKQSSRNRQGSGENFPIEEGSIFSNVEAGLHYHIHNVYNMLIENGVAKEQARKVWPMGGYTIGFMKMDLRNWLHWLTLRLAPEAQFEIREYAKIVNQIIKELFPITHKAFNDYVLESVTLSRLDILYLSRRHKDVFSNKREYEECIDKLERLGLS